SPTGPGRWPAPLSPPCQAQVAKRCRVRPTTARTPWDQDTRDRLAVVPGGPLARVALSWPPPSARPLPSRARPELLPHRPLRSGTVLSTRPPGLAPTALNTAATSPPPPALSVGSPPLRWSSANGCGCASRRNGWRG